MNKALTKPRKPRGKNISVPQVVAMFKSGKTREQIAKELGCNQETLMRAFNRVGMSVKDLEAYQAAKADMMAIKQCKILESITDADIKKTSVRDRLTGFNILHNAERLERGQTTQNICMATITKDLEELEAEEARLKQQLEKLTGNP